MDTWLIVLLSVVAVVVMIVLVYRFGGEKTKENIISFCGTSFLGANMAFGCLIYIAEIAIGIGVIVFIVHLIGSCV